jgi:hypothetical protein
LGTEATVVTKQEAQQCRDTAVEAVKAAQAACAKAIGPIEHQRAKQGLAAALEELAEAKAALRAVNLLAAGARPIEAPADNRQRLVALHLTSGSRRLALISTRPCPPTSRSGR